MREDGAFPTLAPDDIALLEDLGVRRPTAAGDFLHRSGDQSYDFFVVASGAVDIVVATDHRASRQ